MMGHPGAASTRPARGAVSWVTLLGLLALAAAGYLGWVFLPVWVLHYEVKQVVREFGNRAVHDANDAALLEGMVARIRELQTVPATDAAGRAVRVPAVALDPRDVTWERLPGPPRLHVAFDYHRSIDLPYLDRTLERTYRIDLEMDVARPVWAAPR